MSEASTADPTLPAADAAPAAAADTSLTVVGAAPGSEDQGGEQQASEGVQGDGAAVPGQGDNAEQGGEAAASAKAEEPKGDEGGEAQGAPEQYADFTLPEGYALEGEMLDGVRTFAKAHNLNQTQAQALVDLGVQQAGVIADQFLNQAKDMPVILKDHWAQEWSKQTKTDNELGGANLKGTMALAGRVFTTFATPALADFLNSTGLAHHPELIRFMTKVGQAVGEDTLIVPSPGNSGGGQPPGTDTAKVLYPGMN